MAARPLLALPSPVRVSPKKSRPPIEKVAGLGASRQAQLLGPKFDRLRQVLPDPTRLAELRDDPSAIVPERALVFEVAGTLTDFYCAVKTVRGLEFLGEEEDEIAASEDWVIIEKGERKEDKKVSVRLYFTIPDKRALDEIVSLWRIYQAGKKFEYGKSVWKNVFDHLKDVRPWGPQDRLSQETIDNWQKRLKLFPDDPVRCEIEFWYRNGKDNRTQVERYVRNYIYEVNGALLDSADIEQIRYHAVLVELLPSYINNLISRPNVGLALLDDIMSLRPQSVVGKPITDLTEVAEETSSGAIEEELRPPVAALFDGLPMANHRLLSARLDIDDPDDFASLYGQAKEQLHGTAMASAILHGDITNPGSSVRHRLYVRPVLYPQHSGFTEPIELMPANRLGIDLIWRAFRRMMEGEEGEPASAPTVRIVNLSLGDSTRRFAGIMSPWARLIDHLAWEYGLLILISAGNVTDPFLLSDITTWSEFESTTPEGRQRIILESIISNRASRRLFSPSEAINALTIGACFDDMVTFSGSLPFAISPFACSHLPNPSSALGLGFRRGVKPELLFPGGREQIRTSNSHAPIEVRPVSSPTRYFGVRAATPGQQGQTDCIMPHSGTSIATALATNSAIRILESVESIPSDTAYPLVDESFHGVILKSLLVHSAQWDDEAVNFLKTVIDPDGKLHHEHRKEEIARFLGYGTPEIPRVLGCTERRATLIGWGTIGDKQVSQYRSPLPDGLNGIKCFRAITITVAWLTPLNINHRMYRMAKLEAGPGSDPNFSLGVENAQAQPSHNAVGRGTVYHRRWSGDKAAPFTDDGDLVLNISCKAIAGDFDGEIPYGLAVTLEVGQDVNIDIYNEIRNKLRAPVRVPA